MYYEKVVFSIAMMTIALISCNRDDAELNSQSSSSNDNKVEQINENYKGMDGLISALPGPMFEVSVYHGSPARHIPDGDPVFDAGDDCEPSNFFCHGVVSANDAGALGPGFGYNDDDQLVIAFVKSSMDSDIYDSIYLNQDYIEFKGRLDIPEDVRDDLDLDMELEIGPGDYFLNEYSLNGVEIVEIILLDED